jgi:hypothetical protein
MRRIWNIFRIKKATAFSKSCEVSSSHTLHMILRLGVNLKLQVQVFMEHLKQLVRKLLLRPYSMLLYYSRPNKLIV